MSYGILGGLIGSFGLSQYPGIEYVSYKTRVNNGGTITTSLTDLPLEEGDLVLYALAGDTGPATVTTPGYTIIQTEDLDNPSYILAYKFMGSSIDTEVVGSTISGGSALISVFRNVGSVGESAENSGASGDPNPPSITTSVSKSMVVAFGFVDDDVITSFTVPENFTTIGSASNTSGYPSVLGAYYLQDSAGTIDPTVMTNTGDDTWWGVSLALKPKETEFTYHGSYVYPSSSVSGTFSGVKIGKAYETRRVYVVLSWIGTGTNASLTIDGSSATKYSGRSPSTGGSRAAYVFAKDVPSGSTVDVSFSGLSNTSSSGKPTISVYTMPGAIDIASAEVGTISIVTSGGSGTSIAHSTSNGGFLLGLVSLGTSGSPVTTSNTVMNLDYNSEGVDTYPEYLFSYVPTSGSTATTVFSWSTTTANACMVWAFNP